MSVVVGAHDNYDEEDFVVALTMSLSRPRCMSTLTSMSGSEGSRICTQYSAPMILSAECLSSGMADRRWLMMLCGKEQEEEGMG